MEGCKIGHIEPCSEETAQGVIEALRKASELSEASNRLAENIFEDILKSIKNDDMEEKKTKKMTKAEAFEYLKGKRVACDVFNKEDVQCKFFEVGMKWRGGSTNVTEDTGSFIFVDLNGCLTHCNSRAWFDTHEYEEISADDILSIEIVEDGFNYDKVVELAKPLMHYLDEVGCQDSIRISHFGVVHEPMPTLIFDNEIGE